MSDVGAAGAALDIIGRQVAVAAPRYDGLSVRGETVGAMAVAVGKAAFDVDDRLTRLGDSQDGIEAVIPAPAMRERMEPMTGRSAQVCFALSRPQPLRPAQQLTGTRKAELPLQRAIARRRIMFDPGMPPSEAGTGRGKACRPDGGAGAAQDLPGFAGLRVPDWDTILSIAARCYELTGLGYIGVDVVLDRDLGPLVLELNARPGLAIQIANRQGLLRRLKICEERADFGASAVQRIEFAKQEFRHPVGPVYAPADVTTAST